MKNDADSYLPVDRRGAEAVSSTKIFSMFLRELCNSCLPAGVLKIVSVVGRVQRTPLERSTENKGYFTLKKSPSIIRSLTPFSE